MFVNYHLGSDLRYRSPVDNRYITVKGWLRVFLLLRVGILVKNKQNVNRGLSGFVSWLYVQSSYHVRIS